MSPRTMTVAAACAAIAATVVSVAGPGTSADANPTRYQVGSALAISRSASVAKAPARAVQAPAKTTPIAAGKPSPVTSTPTSPASGSSTVTKGAPFCVYSAHTIGELKEFESLMGAPVDCAMLFNASTSWSAWSDPWFLHSPNDPDYAWPAWVKAKAGRRLIVTTSLAPTVGMPKDWMHRGALGQYSSYAITLAKNLVNAGLGNSVIRISHEANGKWNFDKVPDDKAGQQDWRTFWANIVTAMRSVPGANFQFDWAVNYQIRGNISLADFYPGDQFVDIVGLDAYDENTKSMTGRWKFQQTRAGGIDEVVKFAKAHGKKLSFPEWGIIPVNSDMQGGGDQPEYVDGIAQTIKSNDFAYSSYWYAHEDTMSLLKNSPNSLAAMRRHFGANGDAR